jgi:hypothetical protein
MIALMKFTLTSEQKGQGTLTTIRSSQQEATKKGFPPSFGWNTTILFVECTG